MAARFRRREALISRIGDLLAPILANVGGTLRAAIERYRTDAAAVGFHLQSLARKGNLIVGIFGGTGTGKSTLVNRLLGQNLTAASVRRTFTSGAIAITASGDGLPEDWLGVEHVAAGAAEYPLRGKPGALVVAQVGNVLSASGRQAEGAANTASAPPATGENVTLAGRVVLVDTPDLDGDQPAHHAEADRVFRWVRAAVFVVTPEKYQMTELLPYYRLAQRYGLPRLFVMNKAESQAVVDDYVRQLGERFAGGDGRSAADRLESQAVFDPEAQTERGSLHHNEPGVFVVPRDDAGYEPPLAVNLAALRGAIQGMTLPDEETLARGMEQRVSDLVGRLNDQIVAPLRERRLIADRLAAALRGMETPALGVDVNPITQQLRQRLQQRSILYLIGPQRMLDRLRQAPGLLARVPRVAWDYMRTGEVSASSFAPPGGGKAEEPPDFHAILADQFAVVQSRIDDALRSSPAATSWIGDPVEGAGYLQERFEPDTAGKIADAEIADLRAWLDKRWDATPRDTKIVMSLLKHLPGGHRLTSLTEAAPYLLTLALVIHHTLFGMDLLVLGGYSLATWLSERISNEVASRTRSTNQRISDRFTRLVHEQIERTCEWLDQRAPSMKVLGQLDGLVEDAERGHNDS